LETVMNASILESSRANGLAYTGVTFETLIPAIERIASFAFRRLPRWRRVQLVADVVANAFTAFVRLVERGLGHLAYASPLA